MHVKNHSLRFIVISIIQYSNPAAVAAQSPLQPYNPLNRRRGLTLNAGQRKSNLRVDTVSERLCPTAFRII